MKAKQVRKKAPKPKKRTLSSGLTIKQEKFCHEYIDTGNATESYRRVYSTERMKEATVNRNAKSLLDHNKISARIQHLRDQIAEVSTIKKERLLYELQAMLKADVFDFVQFNFDNVEETYDDDTGEKTIKVKPQIILVDPSTLTKEQKRAIKSIKVDKDGNFEITLHDKNWVTDRINKMLGYEAPKLIDHTSKGEKIEGNPIIILPTNNREAEVESGEGDTD